MKRKNLVKLGIDIVMFVVFALFFSKNITGLLFHEAAGLAIGATFLAHVLLNAKWVGNVTKNLFNPKMNLKTRIGWIVDALLAVCMLLIIVSGIAISKVLFPNLSLGNEMVFKMLHIPVAYVALILLGIHVGLHVEWLASFLKGRDGGRMPKAAKLAATVVLSLALLAWGFVSMQQVGFVGQISRLSTIASVGSMSSAPGGERLEGGFSGGDSGKGPGGGMKGGFDKSGAPGADGSAGTDAAGGPPAMGDHGSAQGFSISSTLLLIARYAGIMSFFAILTGWLVRLTARRRKPDAEAATLAA